MHQSIAREMLKRHEGLRLTVYDCPAGKKTIGYGRNLEDRGITRDEANILLTNDITEIEQRLRANFDFYTNLDDIRKAALINLAFNLGMTGLKSFKKMLKALQEGDYTEAAKQLLDSRYATQVPNRAKELALLIKGENGRVNNYGSA